MKTAAPLEGNIVAAIMRRLRQEPDIVVRKRHGTPLGVAGDPDLYGMIRGRHFEIEVKRPLPGCNPTELQFRRLAEWEAAGAIVGLARCAGDALAILGLGDESDPKWLCVGCREWSWRGPNPPWRCAGCRGITFRRERA